VTDTFQIFQTLDPATESALRASIERFGVLVPVVFDQHGHVLDGHHRRRIAEEVGVDYRSDVVVVADADEAREVARTLNSDRRHLTVEQRREMVAALREEGHSLRAIAGATGTSLGTVQRDVAGVSPDTPAEIHGQDGKRYPACRPRPEPVDEDPDEEVDQETNVDANEPAMDRLGRTNKDHRTKQIAERAALGMTSRQIADDIGIGTSAVKGYARDAGIPLADAVLGKPRLLKSNRIVEETVTTLEALATALNYVDLNEVDATNFGHWSESLAESLRALRKFHQQLKEKNQ